MIVLTSIEELGTFQAFLMAVVIAGIVQLILGFLKAGIIGYYFPASVISGMLSGIGLIIILKQIPHAFGYDKDYEGDLAFRQSDGYNTFSELAHMLNFITPGALLIAVLSLAVLILWERPFMKRIKAFQLIQGPLVVVVLGIVLNLVLQSSPVLQLQPEHLVSLPVADNFMGFLQLFTFPDFSKLADPKIYSIAFTLAVVASLETLLCVEATDKLDPDKRITPTNRELKAQGIGNIVSGLIGGLPITQVIVRSSANIQSGGRTKISAIAHGVLMLICAVSIPVVLNLIPLASLAAILLLVGYKLAKPSLFKEVYRQGRQQFIPFIVTIVGILLTDLLVGIALGMAVAIFHLLYRNYKTPYFFHPETYQPGKTIRIDLAEDVTFLNKASIMQTPNHLPANSTAIIDASKSVNVDFDVVEVIENFKQHAHTKGITVEIKELSENKWLKYKEKLAHVRINGDAGKNGAGVPLHFQD